MVGFLTVAILRASTFTPGEYRSPLCQSLGGFPKQPSVRWKSKGQNPEFWPAGPALLLALCRPTGPGAPARMGENGAKRWSPFFQAIKLQLRDMKSLVLSVSQASHLWQLHLSPRCSATQAPHRTHTQPGHGQGRGCQGASN